jgi:hypothetical protein
MLTMNNLLPKLCKSAVLVTVAMVVLAQNAHSQTETLRNPLIPGADYAQPYETPMMSLPPPPGCEGEPWPVTPGMTDRENCLPPTDVTMQPVSPTDRDSVNSAVQPYLTPPASTLGDDPGMIAPNNSGFVPPVALVNINPEGGMPDDQAPQQRWGGQTTRYFGTNLKKSQQSRLFDFGEKLTQKPDLANQPQFSQDGPRPFQTPSDYNSPSRQPQIPGAQQTTDLGIRQLFSGNTQAQQTQPSY